MNKNFAFGRINWILTLASVLLIVFGYMFMGGDASSMTGGFEPDIFSVRRIAVAPMVVLSGFVLMIVAILYKGKE